MLKLNEDKLSYQLILSLPAHANCTYLDTLKHTGMHTQFV